MGSRPKIIHYFIVKQKEWKKNRNTHWIVVDLIIEWMNNAEYSIISVELILLFFTERQETPLSIKKGAFLNAAPSHDRYNG